MPIDEADRKKIVQAIRAHIARERISRDEFARRAKLGKSTVDKLVVGIFSEKTILQVEAQLGIKLLEGAAAGVDVFAAEEFGKYAREDTKNYIGNFIFARPSFYEDGLIHAFHMEIEWDRDASHLMVKELGGGKTVPPQFGKIYIPRSSSHLFILSTEQAWLKQVILSQLDVYKRMKGIMLTMGHAFANVYTPMAVPVIMNKYDAIEPHMVGAVEPGAPMYEEYNRDLLAIEKGQYAKWIHVKQV